MWGLTGGLNAIVRVDPEILEVDERDMVWLSDFGAYAVVRFDLCVRSLKCLVCLATPAMSGRFLAGPTMWLPASAADQLVVIRY